MPSKLGPHGQKTPASSSKTKHHHFDPQKVSQQNYCQMAKGMRVHMIMLSFWSLHGSVLQPNDCSFQCMLSQPWVYNWVLIKMLANQTKCHVKKQQGNLNIEKLWIILLFKGDFNNKNKWLG